jgi:antitoxin component HigA of HigAB toxin-antitoxin module
MNITPIRTKADHKAALKEIESQVGAKAHTAEEDRLDVLVTLVEAYERAHFPMDLPDAVDAIKFRMEQSGLLRQTSIEGEPAEAKRKESVVRHAGWSASDSS